MTDLVDILKVELTDMELRHKFRAALEEISFTPIDLHKWMIGRGDYRDGSASIRGIQRIESGESRVSGPMMVLVNSLVRQHRRLKARHPDLAWSIGVKGTYSTQIEGWDVFIEPKPKGRWLLWCRSGPKKSDYSPSFGRWLATLEEAKNRALMAVEEGMADLAEIEHESRISQ